MSVQICKRKSRLSDQGIPESTFRGESVWSSELFKCVGEGGKKGTWINTLVRVNTWSISDVLGEDSHPRRLGFNVFSTSLGSSQMAPSNHDRIQRLRHEFQQARQGEEPEEHQSSYSFDQSWVSAALCHKDAESTTD